MNKITLATLHLATEQEVFDQVVAHLRSQRVASRDVEACLYRNSAGLKCAAGCLIADDEYKPEMDNPTGDDKNSGTGWSISVKRGTFPNTHDRLISLLQGVHDGGEERWERNFEHIAEDYKLELKAA